MHEVALRGCLLLVVAEQADLVAHGRIAEAPHPQAGRDHVGKPHLGMVAAAGLGHHADERPAMRVEQPVLDEPCIHGRVEQRVVHHVVHVAVKVVVGPTRRDGPEGAEGGTKGRLRSLCHGAGKLTIRGGFVESAGCRDWQARAAVLAEFDHAIKHWSADLSADGPHQLFLAAREAMAKCYAPYSKFPVGAAIRTEDGRVFTGANIENASFPEGWCAETTALSHYVMGGGGKIVEIAVCAEK